MQEVDLQDLTYSAGVQHMRSDAERAAEIMARDGDDLTESEAVFVDTYLQNYDHVKAKLEALVQAHVDEPGILIELLALSDRIDLTLRRFLELQGRSRSDSLDRLATSAADVALQEEAREQASSHGSGAVTPQPWQDPAVWPDFAAFDCPICFDAVTCPEEGSRLKCGHGTCRACAADVVTTAINSAKVLDLCCPAPGCEEEYPYSHIRRLVDAPTFVRYEEFSLLAALAADPNVRWCPAKDCGNAVIREDPNQKKIRCGKCEHEFCADCGEEAHLGTCEALEQWKIENGKVDTAFKQWSKENTKPCPGCKAKIQRNGGCNHFTCPSCNYQFCWLCGRKYGANHYSSFNLAGCPGLQFTEEEDFGVGKRVGFRVLCGAGIVVGVPIIIGLAVPIALVGGTIYGSYRLHKWRKKQMRMRRAGY